MTKNTERFDWDKDNPNKGTKTSHTVRDDGSERTVVQTATKNILGKSAGRIISESDTKRK